VIDTGVEAGSSEARRQGINASEAMPAHRPLYPPLPAYYRDAEFQLIYFRADPAIVQSHLPEPLVADPHGLALAVGLRAPDCSYGPYAETSLRLRCTFGGRVGFYSSHQYVNNVAVLCAGRERWGGPKEYADVVVEQSGDLFCTRTIKEGVEIMTITTRIRGPAIESDLIPTGPSYRLKLIPRADGPGPALKQLISYTSGALSTKQIFHASAELSFGGTANSYLSAFTPREIMGAFYHIIDVTEGYGQIEHDYLR
jgi:acetoacetate decarboxylase